MICLNVVFSYLSCLGGMMFPEFENVWFSSISEKFSVICFFPIFSLSFETPIKIYSTSIYPLCLLTSLLFLFLLVSWVIYLHFFCLWIIFSEVSNLLFYIFKVFLISIFYFICFTLKFVCLFMIVYFFLGF